MTKDRFDTIRESLNRYSDVLTEYEIKTLLENLNNPPSIGIRVNPLKGEPREIIKNLEQKYQWSFTSNSFCDHCWTVKTPDKAPGTTLEHRMGQFYLQDPSSMLPVSLFNIDNPHPLILDMAASPGGKTTHLIDRTHDQGFIIANDASKNRISALRAVLSSWGGINQVITQYPGELLGSWFPETFDYILLDAPCSMENFRHSVSHPTRDISNAERLRLQDRQIQLLRSGLSALKIGGQLVYATCSLAPEEDEAVIDALISDYPKFIRVEDVHQKALLGSPGLTQFGSETYHPSLNRVVRIWPHRTGMSGFFCALITKLAPIPTSRITPPQRDFERTGLKPVDKRVSDQVIEQIKDYFSFDLERILGDYKIGVFQRKDQLFLIPFRYVEKFVTLPYEYIGMPLGRWLKDQIEPSHEFISRFGHLFTDGKVSIREDLVSQWITGRDIRNPKFSQEFKGQYVLVTDTFGCNLGLGKILPNRLRNMLPR